MGAVRTGASGRQRTFDRLYDRFLPNKYDPPSFALKLGHKDMRLATELGRELGVPMRLANMAFAEMTEALNRGWENRDSRSPALLQLERCGLKVEVDSKRVQEVLDRDPLYNGAVQRRIRSDGSRRHKFTEDDVNLTVTSGWRPASRPAPPRSPSNRQAQSAS